MWEGGEAHTSLRQTSGPPGAPEHPTHLPPAPRRGGALCPPLSSAVSWDFEPSVLLALSVLGSGQEWTDRDLTFSKSPSHGSLHLLESSSCFSVPTTRLILTPEDCLPAGRLTAWRKGGLWSPSPQAQTHSVTGQLRLCYRAQRAAWEHILVCHLPGCRSSGTAVITLCLSFLICRMGPVCMRHRGRAWNPRTREQSPSGKCALEQGRLP